MSRPQARLSFARFAQGHENPRSPRGEFTVNLRRLGALPLRKRPEQIATQICKVGSRPRAGPRPGNADRDRAPNQVAVAGPQRAWNSSAGMSQAAGIATPKSLSAVGAICSTLICPGGSASFRLEKKMPRTSAGSTVT